MKTNTWIKRSANNVMWTLFFFFFVVFFFFLSHSFTLEFYFILFLSISSEWKKKQRSVLKRFFFFFLKANLHQSYLSVCTRPLVLYVVNECLRGETMRESSWLQRRDLCLTFLFSSVSFLLLLFSFCLSNTIFWC